ncbi:MAG: hypothetical protein D6800_03965 [Candidatus Zixiibacteriota bacterium]|nr:MAG: hypothetical protein D6800_03965 [candidate division Zixibacteria bacterium]
MVTMKRITCLLVILTLMAVPVLAQGTSDMPGPSRQGSNTSPAGTGAAFGIQPAQNPFSLLDFSRIRWSHSYSVSFFSGGNGSGTVGLLNTTMFYDISRSLSLAVNLGIEHSGGAIWGDANNKARFLPGFTLDYHPSENFRMSLIMQRVDGLYSPYGGPYYGPGSRWYDNR